MSVFRHALLPFAKRFVAGEDIDSALSHVRDLNDDGITAMIDLLGEHLDGEAAVRDATAAYCRILSQIDKEGLDATVSVKPTHLGLEISEDLCREQLEDILEAASGIDEIVWIDMESSDHTDETLRLYRDLREEYDNIGICIQCYLRRSKQDIENLLELEPAIRLVKGAYDEPEEKAYHGKEPVREQYRALLDLLVESNAYLAIGTHDTELIKYAKTVIAESNRTPASYEFQFLMGVRSDLKREMAEKHPVSEYVPYGPEWLSYYWRRVRERRENLWFAIRAVLGSIHMP